MKNERPEVMFALAVIGATLTAGFCTWAIYGLLILPNL